MKKPLFSLSALFLAFCPFAIQLKTDSAPHCARIAVVGRALELDLHELA